MTKIKAYQPIEVMIDSQEQADLAIATILESHNIPKDGRIHNGHLVFDEGEVLREATEADRAAFLCIERILYWKEYLQG